MAQVNMKYMPTPNHEQVVNLDMLNGGLNLNELDYRLKPNESPHMRNLVWRDGVLCTRFGQEYEVEITSTERLTYAIYEKLFHGFVLAHRGAALWYHRIGDTENKWTELYGDVSLDRNPGTFFEYNGVLYYKNRGGYYKITYDPADSGSLTATDVVTSDAYIPVIVINASPRNGSGNLYQPENRLQPKKTVWYNAESGRRTYKLPVENVSNSFIEVYVYDADNLEWDLKERGVDYTLDATAGFVYFAEGHVPPVTEPPTNNTVRITYSKADTDTYNSIMSCNLAATYGGTGDLCIVMGGCEAQPNAIFWNTIGKGAMMDPVYFPMEQYQLVGSSDEPVTGFGKQQSFLVVFKEHSTGRVKQDMVEVDGRVRIDMPYVAINAKIGCDLPKTIQLIDNNLVWCNTEQGVHILKDSSYAYENNIECLSIKVNGSQAKRGLLYDVQNASANMTAGGPCSLDDDKHYWLCVDGKCWVWDYDNTSYKDPSWYYFTSIQAVGFCKEIEELWHINKRGDLTHFLRDPSDPNRFTDYGQPIEKSYRFATQYFGGYDRLKNVNSVIIVIRHDTNANTKVTYLTDYETRSDLTNLQVLAAWWLVPRNLAFRNLSPSSFGAVALRRRPMCRRIKHFTMQLDSVPPTGDESPSQDLSIVSAQIFYNYQGRLR